LKPSQWEMREFRKHRRAIKLLLADFMVVVLVGAFLIFLAAPVESYVSPYVWASFYMVPALGAAFLIVVGLWYASVVAKGFRAMRGDLESVWGDVRLAFRRKWRPTQFSLLMLAIFSLLVLICLGL
ncbi:MAG: hypothetical protein QMD00_03400, partial [Hadesarchaea archaeon]|nr:hypothetical protein [Hadesarchaea archaeon]